MKVILKEIISSNQISLDPILLEIFEKIRIVYKKYSLPYSFELCKNFYKFSSVISSKF